MIILIIITITIIIINNNHYNKPKIYISKIITIIHNINNILSLINKCKYNNKINSRNMSIITNHLSNNKKCKMKITSNINYNNNN